MENTVYDLIVVGAGPAGMTAALYALRAQKTVLLIDDQGYGGQITLSDRVENYPGVADVNGYDLADGMMQQLRAKGVVLKNARVNNVQREDRLFSVSTARDSFAARAVILATGVTHRKLGVAGEDRYIGKGVSFCAVCDGSFFRGREVAVVGGGNTAVQDALYLSELCTRVYLIHRREGFRAESGLLERLKETPNLELLTDTVVVEMQGDERLQAIVVQNLKTREERTLEIAGVFEAIGSVPQNEAFAGLAALDANGYFSSAEDCLTRSEGVFVAGDCRAKKVRQLTTATADGTVAALAAIDYLDNHG